jgi:nucleotide-binding universal stress UspA family protein
VPNAIIEYAEKQHADLIIMRTRGRAGTKQWLLGSLARAVVAHVKCLVLLVQQKIIIQNNHNSKKQDLVGR